MKLTHWPPALLRRALWPPGGPALPAVAVTVPPLAVDSVSQVISNATLWITGILAGLATLFLVLGGVRYLMAGGDAAEVEKAKISLRSAGKGYVLAILAPVIVTILKSLVGG